MALTQTSQPIQQTGGGTPMSVDMSTVPATGLSDFRLTPFLNLTPSPWMVLDMDGVAKGQKTPEQATALAALQAKGVITHTAERNKFEKSFGIALVKGGDAAMPVMQHKDAEVPDMNDARSAHKSGSRVDMGVVPAGPTDTDHSVPQSTAVPRVNSPAGKGNRKRNTATEADRKAKRREQNRRNAAKCRQRKIDRVNELTTQLDALRKENCTLKEAHAKLMKKLTSLEKK